MASHRNRLSNRDRFIINQINVCRSTIKHYKTTKKSKKISNLLRTKLATAVLKSKETPETGAALSFLFLLHKGADGYRAPQGALILVVV